MEIRPVPRNESTALTKQSLGSHIECGPAPLGRSPLRATSQAPIGGFKATPRLLVSQDLELVTQHNDLDLLGLSSPEDEDQDCAKRRP
jgi:hypothetical protein